MIAYRSIDTFSRTFARESRGWEKKEKDEQIKAWMLREGYVNEIMYEYTALICARTGDLVALTNAILSRPGWEQRVRDGLNSEDRQTFWSATEAARLLGIDTWDVYFERLKRGEDLWFFAAQTNDHDRIDRVIAFAEETLPLQEIASGPSDALGLGPEFQNHQALGSVLQELQRFPGKGWPLIRAGLQCPVIRNRNMAVQALATWDRIAWPDEAERLLRHAIEAEPNEQTREIMVQAIEGESA